MKMTKRLKLFVSAVVSVVSEKLLAVLLVLLFSALL